MFPYRFFATLTAHRIDNILSLLESPADQAEALELGAKIDAAAAKWGCKPFEQSGSEPDGGLRHWLENLRTLALARPFYVVLAGCGRDDDVFHPAKFLLKVDGVDKALELRQELQTNVHSIQPKRMYYGDIDDSFDIIGEDDLSPTQIKAADRAVAKVREGNARRKDERCDHVSLREDDPGDSPGVVPGPTRCTDQRVRSNTIDCDSETGRSPAV
jgi:hypothetical protein